MFGGAFLQWGGREDLQLLVSLAYVLGQRAPRLLTVRHVLTRSCWAVLPK